MKRIDTIIMKLIMTFIISISFSALLFAQQLKTISRTYDYVILSGENFTAFTLEKVPIDSLYIFAYNANANSWNPIPFQVDERYTYSVDGTIKSSYFPIGDDLAESEFTPLDSANGLLDSFDEIVILAKHLGDQAAASNWLPEDTEQKFKRYQIRVVDASGGTEKEGWIYLYRSNVNLSRNTTTYIDYDANLDRVISNNFEIGYDDQGTLIDLVVKQTGGGNGKDILDRNKFRYSGKIFGLPYDFSDTTLIKDTYNFENSIEVVKGPIRVIRVLHASLNDPIAKLFTIPFTNIYYPNLYKFSKKVDIDPTLKTELVRLSYDYNENAINMKFYSSDSSGENVNNNILIDGQGKTDGVTDSLSRNEPFWMMVQGNPGTVLTLNKLIYTGQGDYSMRLYYWDSPDGDNADGAALSLGDDKSIGDNGVVFESYKLTDDIYSENNIYFLRSNFPMDSVHTMFDEFTADLQIWRELQLSPAALAVENDGKNNIPGKFTLYQAYPNPFNASTKITFDIPNPDHVTLSIFNIQGQFIATLINQNINAGHHQISWNGVDEYGHSVGSGVYIIKIQTSHENAHVKTILLK